MRTYSSVVWTGLGRFSNIVSTMDLRSSGEASSTSCCSLSSDAASRPPDDLQSAPKLCAAFKCRPFCWTSSAAPRATSCTWRIRALSSRAATSRSRKPSSGGHRGDHDVVGDLQYDGKHVASDNLLGYPYRRWPTAAAAPAGWDPGPPTRPASALATRGRRSIRLSVACPSGRSLDRAEFDDGAGRGDSSSLCAQAGGARAGTEQETSSAGQR